ncbi:hypothetical protein ACHQM5_008209 [Ranunculus cassubicifolius]
MYLLKEEDDMSARLASLTRKVEAIEIKKQTKAKESVESICGICESDAHCTKDCPTIPAFKEVLHDQANAINTYKRPFSQSYNEAYNFNWRKHPNFSWRNGPTANEDENHQGASNPTPYVPPHKKSLEDVLSTFMQGQAQINENTMKSLGELKSSVGRIESHLAVREKGTFPSQPLPNPKSQFEVHDSSPSTSHVEHANVVTTRSAKLNQVVPRTSSEPKENAKPTSDDTSNATQPENAPKTVAPFPQRLIPAKQNKDNKDIFEILQQVKVNIPLLDAIKQIPSYAKFLKDLCTTKRKHNVHKKAQLIIHRIWEKVNTCS